MSSTAGRKSQVESRLPADVRLRRVHYDASQVEAWRALLSGEERARLDGRGVEKRRREFLLGRVAARELLAEVLACAPAEVPLAVAEDGAVDVRNAGRLRLSISHAGDEAVAAVAWRAVGVDLETARRDLERPERMRRFLLAKDERPLLEQRAFSGGEAFTLCWALKESVLKALRCGLRRSPKTVRIASLDVEAEAARLVAREERRVFEACFTRDGAFWLAVACEASHAT